MAVFYVYDYFGSTDDNLNIGQDYYTEVGYINLAFTVSMALNLSSDVLSPNKRVMFSISSGSVDDNTTYYNDAFGIVLTTGTGNLIVSKIDGVNSASITGIGSRTLSNGADCIYEDVTIKTYTPVLADYNFSPSSEVITGSPAIIDDFNASAAPTVPTKAENPSPTNNATDEDFSGLELSWDDGGNTDTFEIYIGETGSLTAFLPTQVGTTFTVTMAELKAVFGTDPIEQKIYWRIDSTNTVGTTTGDEWNFDPRPVKASSPSPSNTATEIAIGLTTTWTGSDIASTFNTLADVGSGLVSQSIGLESATWTPTPTIFEYIIEYTWRVDSTNAFGTTEGDEWTFTTLRLDPPTRTYFYSTTGQHYQLLIQSDGTYGNPPGVGVENTDYVYLAAGYEANFISTNRKLVAAAENRIWYEAI